MLKIILIIQLSFFMSACGTDEVVNHKNKKLIFSNIKSDYKVTDRNNYHCEKIDKKVIKHVLQKGLEVKSRDIHDYYSTTGCTIKGSLKLNNKAENFSFDYGGYIYIGNNMVIGCAKECCKNNFEYCTWEPHGLK
ncbi:MAG: hypothetical protein QM504_00985 [Pseudomonadota bacterium]